MAFANRFSNNVIGCVNSIYSVVCQHYNDQSLNLTFNCNRRHHSWYATLRTKWPQAMEFHATQRSKQNAKKRVYNKLWQYLLQNGAVNPDGHPRLYSDIEIAAWLKERAKPPTINLSDSDIRQIDGLYERFSLLNGEIEEHLEKSNKKKDKRTINLVTGGFYESLSDDEIRQGSEYTKNKWMKRQDMLQNGGSLEHIRQTQNALPITMKRSEILEAIQSNRVVILSGDTGCGKSTQVPQFLLDSYSSNGIGAECNVVVSEPRRLSAVSLAKRVAQERGEKLGEGVGYMVRLDSKSPKQQFGAVNYCTLGVLLKNMQNNRWLEGVSHLIIDEVHERSVEVDFLLILLRRILDQNPNLKVILMSASMNVKLFKNYFENAPVISVSGRCFPVKQHYLEDMIGKVISKREFNDITQFDDSKKRPGTNIDLTVKTIKWIDANKPPGAILCFLDGWADIKSVKDQLTSVLPELSHWVIPVHSRLTSNEQNLIFSETGNNVRKIVLATNIAETGITVNDVAYVVDCGIQKESRLDPKSGVTCIGPQWISAANAVQRSGRAGRVRPGESYHLFTRDRLKQLDPHPIPEMKRVSLEKVILQAKIHCPDMLADEILSAAPEPPRSDEIDRAVQSLYNMRLLDGNEQLTLLGQHAVSFSTDPILARMLIYGVMFRCVDPALTLAAGLSLGRNPFFTTLDNRGEIVATSRSLCPHSDHGVLLEIYKQWQQIDRTNEYERRQFCRNNNLSMSSLKVWDGIRSLLKGNLITSGLGSKFDNVNFALNEHRSLIKAAMVCGLSDRLCRVLYGSIVGNRIKKHERQLMTQNHFKRTQFAADSVNSATYRNGDVPVKTDFYVYHGNFYSDARRTCVLRDTTPVTSHHVALCAPGNIQYKLMNDNDEVNSDVIFRLGGKKFDLVTDQNTARCLLRMRRILDSTIQYQLSQNSRNLFYQSADESSDLTDDVMLLHHDVINTVNKILTEVDETPLLTEVDETPLLTEVDETPLLTEIDKAPLLSESDESPLIEQSTSVDLSSDLIQSLKTGSSRL